MSGTILFVLVSFIFDMGFRAVLFVMTLFYALRSPRDVLDRFVNDLLPVSAPLKASVLRALKVSVEGDNWHVRSGTCENF